MWFLLDAQFMLLYFGVIFDYYCLQHESQEAKYENISKGFFKLDS